MSYKLYLLVNHKRLSYSIHLGQLNGLVSACRLILMLLVQMKQTVRDLCILEAHISEVASGFCGLPL